MLVIKPGFYSQTKFLGYVNSSEHREVNFSLYPDHDSLHAWYVYATEKVFYNTNPPSNENQLVQINCAKNEYESFQIALRSEENLSNVSIEVSDLTNQQNNEIIGKNNISISLVKNVYVYYATKKYWPDPLSPYKPFDLPKDFTQPIWFTVYVNPDVKKGEYTGLITIKSENIVIKTFSLSLTVWNFTLPKEMHCKTAFGLNKGRVKQFHNIDWDHYYSTVRNKYYQSYKDHRVTPGFIEPWYYEALKFSYSNTGDKVVFDINYSEADKLASLYLDDYGFNSFMFGKGIPKTFCGYKNWTQGYNKAIIAFWQNISNHLAAKGWLEKGYYFILDEPYVQAIIHGGDGRDYVNKIKRFATLLKTANSNIKIAQTLYWKWAEPYQILKNYIDIWIPNLRLIDDNVVSTINSGGAEPWFYVCIGNLGSQPNYFITQPGMAPRIFGWMQWRYGVKGNLYYSTTSWTQNPWNNPVHSYWNKAGEGFLIYPSFKDEFSPKPCFDGPSSSIRWEMVREGIEDYEYLCLLDHYISISLAPSVVKSHAKQTLNSAVNTMVKSKTDWNSSPSTVYTIRKIIAMEIK
ncbi:MAG TPA: DUF4091 domain-containing protein, partial [Thermoplasmatales archaeon]|nr:DUF4091 domain-containing protein [Thermoplasmatales archaeon]